MEHDEMGCKHSGCECKMTQRSMMGLPPSFSSVMFSGPDMPTEGSWQGRSFTVGERIRIDIDSEKIVSRKTFTKEYGHIEPDKLFSIAVESLKKMDYFKVWTVDPVGRSMDMTTYGASLMKNGWREQIDLKIEQQQAAGTGSIVRIEVSPSLESGMFGWMAWHRKGVIERIADSIAKMIFETLDQKTH